MTHVLRMSVAWVALAMMAQPLAQQQISSAREEGITLPAVVREVHPQYTRKQ